MKAKNGKELRRNKQGNSNNFSNGIWEENRETMLAAIFNQTSEGIAITDLRGNLIFINNVFATMHGYTPEKLIGKHLSIFHTKDQLPAVRAANDTLLKKGEFKGEIMHAHRDGTIFPTLMHNSILKDQEGHPIGMIGTLVDITDLKNAQQQLHQAYQMQKMTFESLLDAIFIIDADTTKILDCNRAAAKIFGYKRKDMLGKTPDFLHVDPTHLKKFREHLRNAIGKKGFLFLPEFKMKRSSGETFPTEHKVVPIINGQGNRIAWASVVRDITEQLQMMNEIRDKDIFLNDIFLSIQDSICVLDNDLNILITNQQAEKWKSIKNSIKGKKCYKVFHNRTDPCEMCAAVRTLESGKPDYQVVPLNQKGSIQWFEAYTFPLHQETGGNPAGVIEYVRNITERKQLEEKLRVSEQQYKMIFTSTQEGIISTDKDGTIVTANPAAAEILGYSGAEELIGKNGIEIYAHPEKRKELFKQLKEHGTLKNPLMEFIKKDGTHINIHGSVSINLDNKGNIIQTAGIFRDVTSQINNEKQLRESEEKFRLIAETITEVFWSADILTHKTFYVSPAYENIWGRSCESLYKNP